MFPRILTGLILAAALSSRAGTGLAQDLAAADERRIDRLLRGLTAAAFDVRRESESELRSMGADALPRLRDMAESDDLEVRYRVERIIADVERRAVSSALERLEQGEEPRELDLVYGWETFRDQLGSDVQSRRLFSQLLREEPSLMRVVDGPAQELETQFESRCADLGVRRGNRRAAPGLATVAALLFVGGQPECRPSTIAANCINSIVTQGEFRTALNQDDPPELLQLLLGRWIAREETATAMQRLTIAASFELTEGLDVAREMIATNALGAQVQYAVLYIAKLGGPQELHLLEDLLDDDMEIPVGRRQAESDFTSRLQDVALAGLLHLTGQSLADYGFDTDVVRPNETYLYTPGSVGFPDEKAREAAFRQWREWAALNLRELHSAPDWAVEGVTT